MAANQETMEVIRAIDSLQKEIDQKKRNIKEAKAEYKLDLAELDEQKEYSELQADIKVAKAKLDRAILSDQSLNAQRVDINEMNVNLSDLREIMSHHLTQYFKKTGRQIIKLQDMEAMAREIIVTAKLGRETPDEPETIPMELG